jgi:hypothetical protein
MQLRKLILGTTIVSTLPLLAQKDRVSLGLNATYNGPGFLGLGGAIEYQHRLGPHIELLGEFSALRVFHPGDNRPDGPSGAKYLDGTFAFLGGGIGYRSGLDKRGFHVGLLAGVLLYPEYRLTLPNKMVVRPAVGMNIGYSFSERTDLSYELILAPAAGQTLQGFSTLRFSYLLFGKH